MKILYRYEIEYKSYDDDTTIRLREFKCFRETEHTYFISSEYAYLFGGKEKRVRKDADNTYAYDTKKKAVEHFVRRTNTRIKWYKYWIEECKKGLDLIKESHDA
jgi:hypothetical protein